jgi:LAO/AO transport system kinase
VNSAGPESDLAARVLAGNRRAAGRLISLVEDEDDSAEDYLRTIFARSGRAYVVGITGPSGSGKSTLVDELIRVVRESGPSVGVVAVDPNSPFSGGAILGDRIRMMRHAADAGVFIRSMGARGHLGGLALATANTITILDAMGFDVVIVETVGVGQSELEVAGTADTTVVVIPPGLGDGVQAIKAGIMEVADIFAVNKADNPQAGRTIADIRDLIRMDTQPRDWVPPIVKTVATQNEGLEDLWIRIEQHRKHLAKTGILEERRRARLERNVLTIAEKKLRRLVIEPRTDSPEFRRLMEDVLERRTDPYNAADRIVSAT